MGSHNRRLIFLLFKLFCKALKSQIKQLQAKADSEKFNIYGTSFIKDSDPSKSEKNQKVSFKLITRESLIAIFLLQSVNERSDDNTLLDVPGGEIKMANSPSEYQPAFKPVFFDLAINHLKFPSLETEITTSKPGGLTNMVKGWLWRK